MDARHILSFGPGELKPWIAERFSRILGRSKGSGLAPDLYRLWYQQGTLDLDAQGLGADSLQVWRDSLDSRPLLSLKAMESEEGGAKKVLWSLADGHSIETVLVPMTDSGGQDRATLCLSSQAGCAMACSFCETGRWGFRRNLSPAELLSQIHQARFQLGWEFTNLVWMGMGEPLMNLESLVQALRVIFDQQAFRFAQSRVTVCTVGLADKVRQLKAAGFKQMNLSLSLHAGSQAGRERIMPAARTHHLDALVEALRDYPQRKNFVLALNYCLMPGINDHPDDVAGIADLVSRLGRAMVNVIPYNPGTDPISSAPDEACIDTFVHSLRSRGVLTLVRGTKGRSIMAACGQLGARVDH